MGGQTAEERVFSVTELTHAVRALLSGRFASVWVEGEVGRLSRHSSGHVYFSLRDRDATMRAVLFRSNAMRWGRGLEDGARVQCRGRLDVYPPFGTYQLVVEEVRAVGAGDLLRALEELKRRLAEEGLFAEERKRQPPFVPRCVGVVTSPTGAALRDILKELRRRFPLPVVVAPALVQGEKAAETLVAGLQALDAQPDVEVIILARGGGALEDLWCFNDERLVRAVAAAQTPVVSAVGHEIDVVLTDFAADVRAPTPTAAARVVAPEHAALASQLPLWRERANAAVVRQLERNMQQADDLRRRVATATNRAIEGRRQRVAGLRRALTPHHPGARLGQGRRRLHELQQRLAGAGRRLVDVRRRRAGELRATLCALGPEAQLARGYAVVRRVTDDRVVRDAAEAPPGTQIDVLLQRGSLRARVDETRDVSNTDGHARTPERKTH